MTNKERKTKEEIKKKKKKQHKEFIGKQDARYDQ